MRKSASFVLLIYFLHLLSIPAFASAEICIEDEYGLTIQQTCSLHQSFVNYLVSDDGWLAVYSRTADNSDRTAEVYSRAYIDVYSPDGAFAFEISLTTRDEITLAFQESGLEIYLSDYMLKVNLVTHEVTQIQVPRYYAKENGLHAAFTRKKQEVNGWIYSCEGSSMHYTKLLRENENIKETVLSLPGNIPGVDMDVTSFAGKAIACGVLLIISGLIWKTQRVKNKRQAR
jgi:hypothetical protein